MRWMCYMYHTFIKACHIIVRGKIWQVSFGLIKKVIMIYREMNLFNIWKYAPPDLRSVPDIDGCLMNINVGQLSGLLSHWDQGVKSTSALWSRCEMNDGKKKEASVTVWFEPAKGNKGNILHQACLPYKIKVKYWFCVVCFPRSTLQQHRWLH